MKISIKEHLESIIEICEDGRQGYGVAAEKIEDTDLQTLFNRLSQQRKLFIEEITEDARTLGININHSGSVAGFFHRTWLATKAKFASNSLDSIIETSINGEKRALDVYNKNIDGEVPSFINDRLKSQLHLIKVAIHQISSLKREIA